MTMAASPLIDTLVFLWIVRKQGKAVKKVYGKNCFWFGNYDCLWRGQVFEPVKDQNFNTARTNMTTVSVSTL